MTFQRGYDPFTAKPITPASEADVQAAQATADAALEAAGTIVTDGNPPAASPVAVLQAGIGSLFVRWTPVVNADAVFYRVHAAVAVPVEAPEGETSTQVVAYEDMVPGPTNLVADNLTGSLVNVRALADGTPLDSSMVYAVRVIAYDADGAAAPGAQAVGAPALITSPDIAAETILGNHIAGNTITGDKFASELSISSKFIAGATDENGVGIGRRGEWSPEYFRFINSDETLLLNIPNDEDENAHFDGDLTIRTATVREGLSIQSPYNEITSGSGLTLAAGVSNPTGKPGLVIGYDSITLQRVSRSGQSGDSLGTFALNPSRVTSISPTSQTNIFWVVETVSNGSRIWRYNLTTGENVTDSAGRYCWDYPEWRITGIATRDNGNDAWIGQWAGNNEWYVNRALNTPALNIYHDRVGIGDPTIATDGTDWYILESRTGSSAGQMIVRRIGWNSTSLGEVPKTQDVTLSAGSGSTGGTSIIGARIGSMDMGGTRVAYAFQTANTGIRVADHSNGASRNNALEWPSGVTSAQRGFMWHPPTSAWYMLDSAGILIRYTDQMLTAGLNFHVATTVYDSKSAGTGTHETLMSPVASTAMRKRALLRISIPTVPVAGGGADDPDKYRLYAAQSSLSTPPASSTFRLQGEGTTPTTGSGSATLTTISTATTAPPTANNFPGAVPAYVRSIATDGGGSPLVQFAGDGSWRLGSRLSSAASIGDMAWKVGDSTGLTINGWTRINSLRDDEALYPTIGASIGKNGASMVANVDGIYLCVGNIKILAGGGPRLGLSFDAANTYDAPFLDNENSGMPAAPTSGNAYVNGTGIVQAKAGQLIRMFAYVQVSGGRTGGDSTHTYFKVVRIG